MNNVYSMLKAHKKKYPGTISWRLKAHAKIVEKHLNPGEEVYYAFSSQKGNSTFEIFNTYAVVLTNKRIILAQKRLFFGYMFLSITPDMFNDVTVNTGIIWGKVYIDTIKEVVLLSNLSKKAVMEIETELTEYMMQEKQKYINSQKEQ